MSIITVNVVHTLDPDIVPLLQSLFLGRPSSPEASSSPVPAPDAEPKKSDTPITQADPEPTAPTKNPNITFESVHGALLTLKAQKKSAAVREVLDAFSCKTAQDIPEDKYAAVLQMVNQKLEG